MTTIQSVTINYINCTSNKPPIPVNCQTFWLNVVSLFDHCIENTFYWSRASWYGKILENRLLKQPYSGEVNGLWMR